MTKQEPDLAVQTWDALKGASWPIFVAIAEATRDVGLTPAQSSLLFALHTASEEMTPLGVARTLKVTPGTVTGTLNPLEDLGLIERARGEAADRRVVKLRLTAKGRSVMRTWLNGCKSIIESRMATLTDRERRTLIELLSKIAPPQPGVPEGLADSLRIEPRLRRKPARAPSG